MPDLTDIASLRVAAKDGRVHAVVPVIVDAVTEKASKDGKPFLEIQLVDARDRFVLRVWSDNGQFTAAQALATLQAHQALRQTLLAQQQPFAVLRGTLKQQIDQALAALARRHATLMPAGAQTLGRPGWQSMCEKCDDPQCEHRLLSQLLENRAAAQNPSPPAGPQT